MSARELKLLTEEQVTTAFVTVAKALGPARDEVLEAVLQLELLRGDLMRRIAIDNAVEAVVVRPALRLVKPEEPQ